MAPAILKLLQGRRIATLFEPFAGEPHAPLVASREPNAFSALRKAISSQTGMATTFGYGPRYLHSTGQLYKGGPQNAFVLGFVSGKHDDLAVPDKGYTFGDLTLAQAGGDFMVMAAGGQTVLPRVQSVCGGAAAGV